jgi:hypothetical protein
VVCGHIHHAEIRKVGEVDYLNCGDWVESCTALIEHWDGRSSCIAWPMPRRARRSWRLVKAAEPCWAAALPQHFAADRAPASVIVFPERTLPWACQAGQAFFHAAL